MELTARAFFDFAGDTHGAVKEEGALGVDQLELTQGEVDLNRGCSACGNGVGAQVGDTNTCAGLQGIPVGCRVECFDVVRVAEAVFGDHFENGVVGHRIEEFALAPRFWPWSDALKVGFGQFHFSEDRVFNSEQTAGGRVQFAAQGQSVACLKGLNCESGLTAGCSVN